MAFTQVNSQGYTNKKSEKKKSIQKWDRREVGVFPDRPVFLSSWLASHAEKRMRKKQRKTKKEKKDENFLLSWTAGGTYSIDLDIYGAHSPLFIRFRVFPLKRERERPLLLLLLVQGLGTNWGGHKGKPKRTSKFGQVEIISSLGRPTDPIRQTKKKPSRDVQQRAAASSSCKAQSSSSLPKKKFVFISFFLFFQNQVVWKRHKILISS